MKIKPTDKELEILQVLWKQGPSTVREVNEQLSTEKEVGYTTTLKFMQIMHEKGIVSRELFGKTHRYTAIINQESIQQTLVEQLMETAFQGSAMKMVMQVLGNKKSDAKELKEIKEYIDKLNDEQK
ncbi:BlaI/MecI/CopY family transcriptional regulator [Fulvivirga lutea]|uniref:BlaI/MecI/CopY family transcriptional regulator n=1 Tax=Fulvivirga lutea TaxID=2810512 RepID=A0A974WHN1_9BACT|nr:BlaI/MecI/CopY family transcriptional regulator [Fulvivirga lutea]QSE97322.1 BlaI/MecI/CopY family transcriptional regulator [Fulvivirga lutea]